MPVAVGFSEPPHLSVTAALLPLALAFVVDDAFGGVRVVSPSEFASLSDSAQGFHFHDGEVFACHSAACRPPSSGGTGGSSPPVPQNLVRHLAHIEKSYGKDSPEYAGNLKRVNAYMAEKARRSSDVPSGDARHEELLRDPKFKSWSDEDAADLRSLIPSDLSEAIRVRVPSSVVESVLRDGLKTVRETGYSAGNPFKPGALVPETDWQWRDDKEASMYAGASNPIYGYVFNRSQNVGGSTIGVYGTVSVVLKPSVADRTTVVFGDSGGRHPAPLHIKDVRDASSERVTTASMGTRKYLDYVEAHVHGGVAATDIAKIVVSHRESPEVIGELRRLGDAYKVSVEVVDEEKSYSNAWGQRSQYVNFHFHDGEVFACHSAACRPPSSGGTGGSSPGGLPSGPAISPRIDRSVAGKRSGLTTALGPSAHLTDFSAEDQAKMVSDFAKHTGLSHLDTPEKVVGFLMEETERTLGAARAGDPKLTARYWYDAAHSEASDLSMLVGARTTGVGAAVFAVMSPQTPWPDNVALAREVVKLYASKDPISAETLRSAYHDTNNEEISKIRSKMTESEFVSQYGQQRWDTIDPRMGGAIFKSHIQHDPPTLMSVEMDLVPDGHGMFTERAGAPLIAKSGESGAKALMILQSHARNGEGPEFYDTVSNALGNGSKVRNFYDNINTPDSADFVTIDTHSAANMTGFPAGSSSPIVRGVMSTGSVSLGMSQAYPLYQEAVNRVAAAHGLLPREVQSIDWDAQKTFWPDTVKAAYSNTGTGKRPVVSDLQYQLGASARGAAGVLLGRRFRDAVRPLLVERASKQTGGARRKEINGLLRNLRDGLGLSLDELRAARRFAAPVMVSADERRRGVSVP